MAFPKKGKILCLYTDASDKFWSAVVTQTSPTDLMKPVEVQVHEPLAFLGAALRNAECNWSTFEQEGFAIYQAFKKLDFLFHHDEPTHVFTDHRNLLFVFSPLTVEPALGRHIVNKVQRWALYRSQYRYCIDHVAGESNVFADILTRRLKGYRSERRAVRTMCKLARIDGTVDSPSSNTFISPSMTTLREAQRKHPPSPAVDAVVWDAEELLWKRNSCIWIPPQDLALQMKLLVASHCSLGGHRVKDATESIVCEHFIWTNMKDDVHGFVAACIHCLITRTEEVVPRPLGTPLHGSRPNEVVHVDYLYMGIGIEDLKYILLVRDDLSSFVWLNSTTSATAEFAADVLSKWVSMFGSMSWLVTDQGSHFQDIVHTSMIRKFRTRKHFTTAYSPWANGTVERANRGVLRATNTLLSE